MKVFITLAAAIILHGIFIYYVLFKLPMREQKAPPYMDVTLITQPADKKPKEAKSIATDNQLASKSASDAKERVARQKEVKATSSSVKEKTAKKVEPSVTIEHKKSLPSVDIAQKDDNEKPRFTAESLQQQISQLGDDIRQQRMETMQTASKRMKSIDTLSASKNIAAQYMKDFQTKVERVGSMNYPLDAIQKSASSEPFVNMQIGIRADGSIYEINIIKSSGNPEIDEAAKKILHMSEPFPALPPDLLKELDVFIIERSWTFKDQSGITTQ
jgi:protein TonB